MIVTNILPYGAGDTVIHFEVDDLTIPVDRTLAEPLIRRFWRGEKVDLTTEVPPQ